MTRINIDRFLIIRPRDDAPDFEGVTIEGEKLRLSEFRGKVVLVDFWATWCGPCIAELPNVRKALDEHGGDGDFVVIGISLDASEKTVKQFVKDRKMGWPQIVMGPADKNEIAKLYNVSGVPATFLIDRDGKVVATDLRGGLLRLHLKKLMEPEE